MHVHYISWYTAANLTSTHVQPQVYTLKNLGAACIKQEIKLTASRDSFLNIRFFFIITLESSVDPRVMCTK